MPLLTYASPGWFPFLSATNFTQLECSTERLVTPSLAASHPPLYLCFSLRFLYFPYDPPLTHFTLFFYEHAICLPTSFTISGLARLGVKPRLCISSWIAFVSPHPLMLSFTCSREALFACLPVLLGICFPSQWSPPFPLHALALIPLYLTKVRLSPILTLFSLMIWCFGQTALFLFLLATTAPAYLPTALSVALRPLFFFSAGPVCFSVFLFSRPSFSAEACAILHALYWSWQHHEVCHFSSLLLLSNSCSVLATLSSPQSFLLSQILWQIWQELSSLSYCSIRLQWVPGHLFFLGNDTADELAR